MNSRLHKHKLYLLPALPYPTISFPVELIGVKLAMMCNYIRFCANRLLRSLGCGRHYKIGNSFEWTETISLQDKTNFFEKRVGEYSKSGEGTDSADQSFALDASF